MRLTAIALAIACAVGFAFSVESAARPQYVVLWNEVVRGSEFSVATNLELRVAFVESKQDAVELLGRIDLDPDYFVGFFYIEREEGVIGSSEIVANERVVIDKSIEHYWRTTP